jgi:hypothetical protein
MNHLRGIPRLNLMGSSGGYAPLSVYCRLDKHLTLHAPNVWHVSDTLVKLPANLLWESTDDRS